MIKASHNPFLVWLFKLFTRIIIHSRFHKIFIEGDTSSQPSSMLVISNHFSWWDGFFIHYLNNKLWKKRFHVMMLEEELAKRKFLSKGGAFSIRRNHSTSATSLIYAKNILKNDAQNLLLMYPQGKLQSMATRYLRFEPGVQHLVQKTGVTVKMVVSLVDFFEKPRPSVWLYLKDLYYDSESEQTIEQSFNMFMDECIEHHNQNTDL